jgi:hypothetical protein
MESILIKSKFQTVFSNDGVIQVLLMKCIFVPRKHGANRAINIRVGLSGKGPDPVTSQTPFFGEEGQAGFD